jgi:hypothetical protein
MIGRMIVLETMARDAHPGFSTMVETELFIVARRLWTAALALRFVRNLW